MNDRVPLSTQLFFGAGAIAEGVKNTAFNVFLLFYYNQVLGVSGTWTGTAIFLALCVDAVMDPLVGSLSDGWRSRWGRRHPFMYVAAVPMGVCFFLLFLPPAGLSERGLFVWLLVFAVGVRGSMTLYMLPSNAMVPELTASYDGRTALVSWRYPVRMVRRHRDLARRLPALLREPRRREGRAARSVRLCGLWSRLRPARGGRDPDELSRHPSPDSAARAACEPRGVHAETLCRRAALGARDSLVSGAA